MPDYREVRNGFISGEIDEAHFAIVVRNLKSYIRSSLNNPTVKVEPTLVSEVIRDMNSLTGGDFRSFLIANYNNGLGPVSQLSKEIVSFLYDGTNLSGLTTRINVEERKNQFHEEPAMKNVPRYISVDGTSSDKFNNVDKIVNYDFYRVLAALSPIGMARLFLVLSGETYDYRIK